MAPGCNCLRKEGEEEKILVLFYNAHIVISDTIYLSLLFQDNSFYSRYACVCHIPMEKLKNYEDE